jgi:hypothetical protein
MCAFKLLLFLGAVVTVRTGPAWIHEKVDSEDHAWETITERINVRTTPSGRIVFSDDPQHIEENVNVEDSTNIINSDIFGEFEIRNFNDNTDDDDIVEPVAAVEATCHNNTDYCLDPPLYPGRNIHDAVEKSGNIIKSMFFHHKPILLRSSFDIFNATYDDYDYNSIEEDDETYNNVCEMETDFIRPRVAKNIDGEFKFIVNLPMDDDKFVQIVRVGHCVGAGLECGGGDIFSESVTMCKQNYMEHKLVAANTAGDEVIIDTFRFPSCCTCHVRPDNIY